MLHTMRRRDREVSGLQDKLDIIERCDVCRIGMMDEEGMYIVPMNFGYKYENDTLIFYFHGSKDGRKVDALKKNPDVCFQLDCDHEIVTGDMPCLYGYKYKSIFGTGRAEIIEDLDEKKEALALMMKKYTGEDFEINDAMAKSIAITKLTADTFTGKARTK